MSVAPANDNGVVDLTGGNSSNSEDDEEDITTLETAINDKDFSSSGNIISCPNKKRKRQQKVTTTNTNDKKKANNSSTVDLTSVSDDENDDDNGNKDNNKDKRPSAATKPKPTQIDIIGIDDTEHTTSYKHDSPVTMSRCATSTQDENEDNDYKTVLTQKPQSQSSSSSSSQQQQVVNHDKSHDNDGEMEKMQVVQPVSESKAQHENEDNHSKTELTQKPQLQSSLSQQHQQQVVNHDKSHDNDGEMEKMPVVQPVSEPEPEPEPEPTKITPMHRILEIFPDADLSYTKKIFTLNNMKPSRINKPIRSKFRDSFEAIIQLVISHLAENPSYPKSKTTTATTTNASGIVIQPSGTLLSRQRKYDYMSISSFEPTKDYIQQSLELLELDFPCLSKYGIKYFFDTCQQHYAICHERICRLVMGKKVNNGTANTASASANINNDDNEIPQEEQEYRLLMNAMSGGRLNAEQRYRLQAPIISTDTKATQQQQTTLSEPRRVRKASPYQIQNETLQDERDYVQNKFAEWKHEIDVRIERREARHLSEMTGSTVECNCCFGDVSMEEMTACKEEGHLFCVDCLRRHAETKVFGDGNFGIDKETGKPHIELQCMHFEGCASSFESDHLQKALPTKTMEKYNEIQAAAVLEQAGLEDTICKCRKCGYPAMLPPTEMIFVCPIQGCGHSQCRKCGEVPHIPLRCEEVEKPHETDGRRRVEEAITEAKIRTCPKPECGKKFIKESGCNKMTCSCGTYVCYVCRKEIPKSVGYQHFCQIPHCKHTDPSKCTGCPVYSNNEEDDERAMREAGITAAEQVREESVLSETTTSADTNNNDKKRKASEQETGTPDGEVRIDVDTLLGEPATKAATAASTTMNRTWGTRAAAATTMNRTWGSRVAAARDPQAPPRIRKPRADISEMQRQIEQRHQRQNQWRPKVDTIEMQQQIEQMLQNRERMHQRQNQRDQQKREQQAVSNRPQLTHQRQQQPQPQPQRYQPTHPRRGMPVHHHRSPPRNHSQPNQRVYLTQWQKQQQPHHGGRRGVRVPPSASPHVRHRDRKQYQRT